MKLLINSFKEKWRISGYALLSIGIYRLGNYTYKNLRYPVVYPILMIFYKFLDLLIVQGFNNSEIHYPTKIGENLKLPHGGKGVIISSKASIGNNVTIYHQVTIGTIKANGGAPKIGDNVFIGAGAKVLGPIVIGEGAKIGANAVVIHDVPANKTTTGVPAKLQ
ncbi:serine O-acetyltransferase [Rossellomorea aquimaris]|uniref:Serine acetyltransferase n=1 Tax=Rossellomorea aquimaris TaxID=189382 RepID=A0A5D4U6Y2_9BACI|nr:DapH/DapD/GlmU-related protein [Rossellomorea aquimaris]TYS76412.1 serine O-acetyltransferase [Rossellomorea aquimaris]TYS83002.1 serine O-acetyltransferase [Rossellomorea aquimaris]